MQSDAVVDVAEAGSLHRERAAVVDRSRDDVDDLAGVLVDQLQLATVGAEVVEAEDPLGRGDGGCWSRRVSVTAP